jgi:dienelactone hydrolase
MLQGIAFATVLAGAGCGGEAPATPEGTGTSATTTPAANGGAGKAAPATMNMAAAGSGAKSPTGMTTPAGMTKPAGGANMMAMTTPAANAGGPASAAAGAGGAPTAANAGSPATAGGPAAGSAGAAGSAPAAGAAGGGAAPVDMGGAFAIRGADPTEDSANGRTEGPYAVESYTSGYMRGDFSDATMWYPTSEDAKPPFGCVAVVPGFVSPQSSIRNWGPFLASNGIVAITIGVPGSDPPASRAMSLLSALETCKGENERADSPIKGKLSVDHLGVSGWSMGGGGTLIAASQNPMGQIKAAVSFAAWGPNGGDKNKVPALMFEATADALAASMSDGYYRAMSEEVPKMLFEVQGSSHNVANDPANHEGIIGKYGLSWWKVYMEGDMRYKKFLTAAPPDIVTQKFATNVK